MINNTFGLISTSGFQSSASTRQNMKGKAKNILRVLFVSFLLILLSACNASAQNAIPTPEAGKGHVIGTIQTTDGKPYKQFSIRLAEVYWQDNQGAYVLDESFSPGGMSNDKGAFQVLNVPEGEYVIIIGNAVETYEPVTDDKGVLLRVTAKAGETIDLGTIVFDSKP